MSFEVTTASVEDVALYKQWADDEQWNPGTRDMAAFHAADPAGFFLGKLDGVPVASLSAVRYGKDFAFLGFYITRPELRGQGYGIQLWDAAMERLAGRNVGLDGVVEQQDNYRKSGFRRVWNHVRYEGVPTVDESPPDVTLIDGRTAPFDWLLAYDLRFFPAERPAFLSAWVNLPGHTSVAAVRDGHLHAHHGGPADAAQFFAPPAESERVTAVAITGNGGGGQRWVLRQ